MEKPRMVLWGGERDGWDCPLPASQRPNVFYVVPHEHEAKISACKSIRAKLERREQLATLAYQYDPARSTPMRFVMVRTPALDRVPQT